MKKIVHTSRNQMLQLAVEFEMNRLFQIRWSYCLH